MANYFTYLANADNEAVGATITPSTEDSIYPAANLTALPISKVFRFTGDTSETILFDLLAAMTLSLVAIINHNLTSGATITLTAGTTSACSDYSVAVSYRADDAFKYIAGGRTYRYWKLTFADAANPDGYIEIGFVMLGLSTTLSTQFYHQWREVQDHINYEFISEMGVEHVARLYKRRRFIFRWRALTEAQMDEVTGMLAAVEKNYTPLFILPDPSGSDGYFGRWINDPEIDIEYYRSGMIEFRESSRGRTIGS